MRPAHAKHSNDSKTPRLSRLNSSRDFIWFQYALTSADETGNDEDHEHREGCSCRDKAELTERTDHVSLEVKQPAGEQRHEHDLDTEKRPGRAVAECGEKGE